MELLSFQKYVGQLLRQYKDKRVHLFEYNGQFFWLKQPEKLKGVETFLKPHPKLTFKHELERLIELNKMHMPVPEIVLQGDEFVVLKDCGRSLSSIIDDPNISFESKKHMITVAIQSLNQIHQLGIIHGRPAIRDLLWLEGKITFVDFETTPKGNKDVLICRDMIHFLYSLCRKESVLNSELDEYFALYQKLCPNYWQMMLTYLNKFRFIYFLLRPFKPIAKKDLLAIYRLFGHLY